MSLLQGGAGGAHAVLAGASSLEDKVTMEEGTRLVKINFKSLLEAL